MAESLVPTTYKIAIKHMKQNILLTCIFGLGKLFFTPMNNATLRIIKEFNKTFEHVDTIKRLVNSLMQARNEMFQQLYEFMSDPLHPKKPKDRVFMDLLSQSMGEKLHNQSEATKLFFSNAVPQPGQVTWQNTFNQTFDYLKSGMLQLEIQVRGSNQN